MSRCNGVEQVENRGPCACSTVWHFKRTGVTPGLGTGPSASSFETLLLLQRLHACRIDARISRTA